MTTSGAVVWSAVYDSFGNCQVDASSTITNNLHGPGQYHDAETGLYYNLNRYYDPATGRYLSTDPIEDGLNLYAYCFNNPDNLMDPEGLSCSSEEERFHAHLQAYVRNAHAQERRTGAASSKDARTGIFRVNADLYPCYDQRPQGDSREVSPR